jgi:hypothetical protein
MSDSNFTDWMERMYLLPPRTRFTYDIDQITSRGFRSLVRRNHQALLSHHRVSGIPRLPPPNLKPMPRSLYSSPLRHWHFQTINLLSRRIFGCSAKTLLFGKQNHQETEARSRTFSLLKIAKHFSRTRKKNPDRGYGPNPWGRAGRLRCKRCRDWRRQVTLISLCSLTS